MPVDTSEAVRIFMEKEKKQGNAPGAVMNEIKTGMMYDPNAGAGEPDLATGTKAQQTTKKLPGAFWDHGGTTYFNPLPTDPRVEAILGEKKYKQAISKDSPDEMRLQIASLTDKVETLTKLLGQKVEVKPEEPPIKIEAETPDYENMNYHDLLAYAKSMFPDLPGRPKKGVLIEMIQHKENG